MTRRHFRIRTALIATSALSLMGITLASAQSQGMNEGKGATGEQVKVCLQQRAGSGYFGGGLSHAERTTIRLRYRACVLQAVSLNKGHASSDSSQSTIVVLPPASTCSNLYWFDHTNDNQCQARKRFCGTYMYYGLQTFAQQQDCFDALTIGSCTPDWRCDWGACTNGWQSQTPVDSNNCGGTSGQIACPALAIRCAPSTQCKADTDCPQIACFVAPCPTNTCVNGQCVISPAFPSITILSPNGGETWRIGETRKISWQTNTISSPNDNITIYLVPAEDVSKNYSLAQQIPNIGSYTYIVDDPAKFSSRSPLFAAGGKFKILICVQAANNADLCTYARDYSDASFSILAASTQPSITVTSPNGGETFKNDGSPITVNWITKNVPSFQQFDVIRLRAYPNGQEYNLAFNVLNDGQEVVQLSSVPVGAYTLEIKTYVNGTLVMDSSNSYFKIIDVASPVVSEQVKCIFHGATTEQKCYVATSDSSLIFSCSGIGTCVVGVKGPKNTSFTWKSSCGGYAYTTLDGNNEYANFSCGDTTPPIISEQVKCIFHGATTEQRCDTAYPSSSPLSFTCSGIGTCVADVKGPKGTSLTWKSSCGGYAYSTLDGVSEYANFSCGDTVPGN